MGVIFDLLKAVFGSNGSALRETVEVFRENSEAGAERAFQLRSAALQQFAEEFKPTGRSAFDQLMDGINRLPRPLLALGTVGLLISAMASPDWFTSRMVGLSLVPEPLWWLLGVVVSFYFGARHQAKTQDFQRQVLSGLQLHASMQAMLRQDQVDASIPSLSEGGISSGFMTDDRGGFPEVEQTTDNPALAELIRRKSQAE